MTKEMKKRILVLFIAAIFLLVGCSAPEVPANVDSPEEVSGNLEEGIVIKGLEAKEILLSVEEIREIESVSKEVTSINSSGEKNTFQVTGALLEKVLQRHGYSQRDLMRVRFVAGDGYSIEVPKEIIDTRDIILAYEMNGGPLEPKNQPLRVIIPDERAMYWVGNLTTIEVLEGIEKSQINKVLLLETLSKALDAEDYDYYDSVDQAIKTKDLLQQVETENTSETVYLKAADGLEKNEALSIFEEAYIKITGVDAPAFLAPDMPKGMQVKGILYFANGSTGWLSYEKARECHETLNFGDKEGISIVSLLKTLDFMEGESYIFTASDGYMVEISSGDLEKGLLYKDEEGRINVYFDGLPKNTSVRDVLSIEVK